MSLVELVVGEEPLRNNAATLAESGVSGDTAVLAVLRTRSVRCVRKEEAAYSLDDVDARVVLENSILGIQWLLLHPNPDDPKFRGKHWVGSIPWL